jgi:hypothetical protein
VAAGGFDEESEDASDRVGLDQALAKLARGRGRTRLWIGQAADALITSSGHRELGFPSVRAYAYERLGQSGAWVHESRRVARALEALPLCKEALSCGRISWKMAELLTRHATVSDERIVLAAATRSTVREMAALFADCEAARESAEEDESGRRTVKIVRQAEAGTVYEAEVTRRIVALMEGRDLGRGWIEPVVAEATSTMQNAGVDPFIETVASECGSLIARRREATSAREVLEQRAEERAEREGRPMWLVDGFGVEDDWPLPTDPWALDAALRALCKSLAAGDVWLGGGLARFHRAKGWAPLGYASFEQYVRERLGMGRSAARAKMKLARDSDRLPAIGDAIVRGEIEEAAATLVARVATHRTVGAWLERARERTYKHLREEVELVETMPVVHRGRCEGALGTDGLCEACGLSVSSMGGAPLPPSDDEVKTWQALESAMLSGELIEKELENGGVRMCEPSRKGRREIVFRVPEDSFTEFRMMEVAYQRAGFGGEFLSWLCRTFWAVWRPHLGSSDKWEAVYRRDGYRCQSPVCMRCDVTLHHLLYRALGGGDAFENLLSLCPACHLEGEHEGRLTVTGPADEPTWRLGRRGRAPLLVVKGRRRTSASPLQTISLFQ